jgi:hypothetical protein
MRLGKWSVKVAHRCLCTQSSEQSIGGRCVVTKCHSSSRLRLSDREREREKERAGRYRQVCYRFGRETFGRWKR